MIYGIVGFLLGAVLLYILSFIIPRERIRKHNCKLDAEEGAQKERIAQAQLSAEIAEKDISILNLTKDGLKNEIEIAKCHAQEQAESYYNEKIAEAETRFQRALSAIEVSLEREARNRQEKHLSMLSKLDDEYKAMREDATLSFAKQIKTAKLELNNLQSSLKFLKECVDAATAENQRMKLEAEAKDFYRVVISSEDIEEILKIRSIEPYLRNAEVINKVIWTYYYRSSANDMINRVLGSTSKTGIYKITNILNGMVYIGQAVNVKERWLQHIKRGLGAENGGRMKLYPAMYEHGVENFTFELLEECSQDDLNDKEKYWIDFYNGIEYGYNMKV